MSKTRASRRGQYPRSRVRRPRGPDVEDEVGDIENVDLEIEDDRTRTIMVFDVEVLDVEDLVLDIIEDVALYLEDDVLDVEDEVEDKVEDDDVCPRRRGRLRPRP